MESNNPKDNLDVEKFEEFNHSIVSQVTKSKNTEFITEENQNQDINSFDNLFSNTSNLVQFDQNNLIKSILFLGEKSKQIEKRQYDSEDQLENIKKASKAVNDRCTIHEENLAKVEEDIKRLFRKTEINIKNKLLDTLVNINGITEILLYLPHMGPELKSLSEKMGLMETRMTTVEGKLDETIGKVDHIQKQHRENTNKVDGVISKNIDMEDRLLQQEYYSSMVVKTDEMKYFKEEIRQSIDDQVLKIIELQNIKKINEQEKRQSRVSNANQIPISFMQNSQSGNDFNKSSPVDNELLNNQVKLETFNTNKYDVFQKINYFEQFIEEIRFKTSESNLKHIFKENENKLSDNLKKEDFEGKIKEFEEKLFKINFKIEGNTETLTQKIHEVIYSLSDLKKSTSKEFNNSVELISTRVNKLFDRVKTINNQVRENTEVMNNLSNIIMQGNFNHNNNDSHHNKKKTSPIKSEKLPVCSQCSNVKTNCTCNDQNAKANKLDRRQSSMAIVQTKKESEEFRKITSNLNETIMDNNEAEPEFKIPYQDSVSEPNPSNNKSQKSGIHKKEHRKDKKDDQMLSSMSSMELIKVSDNIHKDVSMPAKSEEVEIGINTKITELEGIFKEHRAQVQQSINQIQDEIQSVNDKILEMSSNKEIRSQVESLQNEQNKLHTLVNNSASYGSKMPTDQIYTQVERLKQEMEGMLINNNHSFTKIKQEIEGQASMNKVTEMFHQIENELKYYKSKTDGEMDRKADVEMLMNFLKHVNLLGQHIENDIPMFSKRKIEQCASCHQPVLGRNSPNRTMPNGFNMNGAGIGNVNAGLLQQFRPYRSFYNSNDLGNKYSKNISNYKLTAQESKIIDGKLVDRLENNINFSANKDLSEQAKRKMENEDQSLSKFEKGDDGVKLPKINQSLDQEYFSKKNNSIVSTKNSQSKLVNKTQKEKWVSPLKIQEKFEVQYKNRNK